MKLLYVAGPIVPIIVSGRGGYINFKEFPEWLLLSVIVSLTIYMNYIILLELIDDYFDFKRRKHIDNIDKSCFILEFLTYLSLLSVLPCLMVNLNFQ